MRRAIQASVLAILAIGLLYFGLTPYTQRDHWLTWVGLIGTTSATVIVIVTNHRAFGAWRGFGALAFLHIAAQVWLYTQWDLWNSPDTLARNLNAIAGWIAFATMIAMLTSVMLLLTFRDASVIALACAWLGCPILLLATMIRYRTLDQLDRITLREQLPLVVLMVFLIFLPSAGILTFLIHLARLLSDEIRGRT